MTDLDEFDKTNHDLFFPVEVCYDFELKLLSSCLYRTEEFGYFQPLLHVSKNEKEKFNPHAWIVKTNRDLSAITRAEFD